MVMKADENEILETIKSILRKVQELELSGKVDVERVVIDDDLRLLGLDSLDVISFRFALDEVIGFEIPDEDFEEKELTNIRKLIDYIKNRIQK